MELATSFQRAATEIVDVAEAMPVDQYGYKPTPEVSRFGDQLAHIAGIDQRFIATESCRQQTARRSASHTGAPRESPSSPSGQRCAAAPGR